MFFQMRAIALFAIAISFLANAVEAHAQSALDIQGIDIALGMDRPTVVQKLKNFRLSCTECASILVISKRQPYEPYANVVFEGDRVKSIRKYWSRGFSGSAPGKFVQTLYSVLSNAGAQAAVRFQISVSERRDPGALQQTVFLKSGRKTISISYGEGLRGADGMKIPPFVYLDEIIE